MGTGASSPWSINAAHCLRAPARALDSPHQDERPDGEDPSLIVIHAISLPPNEFGGPWIDDLFLGRLDARAHPYFADVAALRVSAHLCLFRDGAVTQYVPFDRRAWHAGVSSWQGRERCNDFSVGIELEGSDEAAFAPVQYRNLRGILLALFARYPRLSAATLAAHSEIAPGRKTDPGPRFDWSHLNALLAA